MADLIANKENDFYQSSVKVISLLFLEIVSAFLMIFYLRQVIVAFNGQNLMLFLAGFGLFIIFSFLSALFINGMLWSSLAAGLSVVASLAVFYDYFSITLIISGLFVFLIFIWAIHSLRSELDNSLKIRFSRLVKIFLAKTTLGLAILITLFYYSLASTQGGFLVSFDNFKFLALNPNEKIIGIFIPDFSFQKPLQTVLVGVFEKQLADKIPGFESLPASAKETILKAAVQQQFLDGLEKFFGSKINANDPIDKIIYNVLTIKFNQLSETFKYWITIGIFIILFLIIQFVFIPVKWILVVVLSSVYLLLLALHFARVKIEPRSKEILVM